MMMTAHRLPCYARTWMAGGTMRILYALMGVATLMLVMFASPDVFLHT
jgi:hypothetical protein